MAPAPPVDPDVEPYVPVVPLTPQQPALSSGRPAAALKRSTAPKVALPACVPKTEQLVEDGAAIVVSMPPAIFTVGQLGIAFWAKPPNTDPTWQMHLYSFRWLVPLLGRAVQDGQLKARDELINEVVRFYRDNPDRGASVKGWDEGSSLRRLEHLNCMYAMTKDRRLITPMQTEVALQFGPRYYGPPRHPVHNHGLMANLRVIEAGRLLNRPDWIAAAGKRMRVEAPLSFSAAGTSWEQSSQYQILNRNMWAAAASALETINRADPAVAAIRATTKRADNVSQWFTEPDGRLVQIGDATRAPGLPAPKRTDPGIFRDDPAGFIVGRWSWKDPKTSYYTLRYGPPRRAHGHPDKGSVTWSTAGSRVLVGSGYIGYDMLDPFVRYQKSPEAANVAIPAGAVLRNTPATITRASRSRHAHRWTVADSVFRKSHTRTVDVNNLTRTLSVWDAFRGGGTADQMWHLDPVWQLVSTSPNAQTLRFRRPDGRILQIVTTGRFESVKRGQTRPVAGWTFPATRQRTANYELRVRWVAGTVKTTFQVL